MSILKKIAGWVTIGLGTAAMAFTLVQFPNEIKFDPKTADQKLVIDLSDTESGLVAIVGDTGLNSPQRRAVLADLAQVCPKFLIIPGDPGYPSGPNNDEEYDAHVRPFEKLCPNHEKTFLTGGNHAFLKFTAENYLSKTLFGKADRRVVMLNYYYLVTLKDRCWIVNETTVYDAKIDPKIEKRQEKFTDWAIKHPKCQGNPIDFIGHHFVYTRPDRKRAPKNDLVDFYKKHLKGKITNYFAGHDHLFWTGVKDGITHVVSGLGSKSYGDPISYAVMLNGEIWERKVQGLPFVEQEDD